ncbi:MAG: imidazoleglycerol-phosphate dehydratase HisB [Clostridia bacterium]
MRWRYVWKRKKAITVRKGQIVRKTRETDITVTLSLDTQGKADVQTGIGFFDHMLTSFCRFGMIDLTVRCHGDLEVDGHHTVEDVGICIGQALREALGDKRGIRRMAHAMVPMDEALALAALDISGRPMLCFDASFGTAQVGGFDTELAEEFFRAVAVAAGLTLHLRMMAGRNAHHMLEAMFKAFGRALDDATRLDERLEGMVPSTKGILA